MKAASLLFLVFSCGTLLQAQAPVQSGDAVRTKYAESITSDELREHLMILASDAYEGRETGMPGQKKAAEYLANYYESLGVKPCNQGSWFQQYPLKEEKRTGSTIQVGSTGFNFIDDFFFFGGFGLSDAELENIIFLGYGIDSEKYSDYKGVDVQGKTVVCLMGDPMDKKGNSYLTGTSQVSAWSQDMFAKVEYATEKGARAIVLINPDYDFYITRVKPWLTRPEVRLDMPGEEEKKDELIPYFFVSPKMGDAILKAGGAKNVETVKKKIASKGKPFKKPLKGKLKIHVERNAKKITAENVLCFIEGSDPGLRKEVVVVSAHYDHIGIGTDGQINNGADDDGSGTVATLEIAEAFMQAVNDGKGPKRSVLVLNFSGEEKGLLGSEWYSEFPVFPLENTVCDLNIDMIGRIDDEHKESELEYVYLIGSDKLSTSLHKLSEETNALYTGLDLDYTFNDPKDPNRYYYRSDHYNFAKKNVPVIFYFSGVHEDYHRPGDDPEKIQYEKMETITRLIFLTAWEVANRPERLVVDVQNDFEND